MGKSSQSSNPELSRKMLVSAVITLISSGGAFYFGNRYTQQLLSYEGNIFNHVSDAAGGMFTLIRQFPFQIDKRSPCVLTGLGLCIIVWLIWMYYIQSFEILRVGEESGSARWGTKKEGKKFLDTTNEDNNLLFTENYGLALSRPKFDQELDRNLNVLVVGGSGSGKTFNYVTPNICQLNSSYFITDPKGTLLNDAGFLFTDNGYRVKAFNLINLEDSMHYNPLKYVKTDTDILSFVNCYIVNTNGDGKAGDPFWENAEKMLYTSLIALLRDWFPKEDYNLSSLLTLLSLAEASENDENFKSPLDLIFKQIEDGKRYIDTGAGALQSADATPAQGLSRSFTSGKARSSFSWEPSLFIRNSDGVKPAEKGGLSPDEDFALMNYKNFKVAAGKTLKSIIISCNVRLAPIATAGVRELLTKDEMDLDTLGDKDSKSVIFGILSDTDKTLSFLFAIMMWQCIDQLCRKALKDYGGRLPRSVHFIFDEFANIGTIPQIEETIAVTRSRNIGITIILQSMAQLESKYDKKAKTIIDCCDTTLFLGGKSNSTNKEISEMIGKQTIRQKTYGSSSGQSSSSSKNTQIGSRDLIDAAEIGKMSRKKAILLIAGTNPLMDKKYDPRTHPRYGHLVDKRNPNRLHDESFDFGRYVREGKSYLIQQ
ncbi:VirD4-like conjugal transfer protein, CD1115 family [Arcanobacterium hippocoleae]|uniref:Type IV secretion system protein VirD4 n=1 Tax=Arcanobacterium hippocoleae TaxID=149017 RepID=A0ABU1T1L3_9ACTO|nr:type IV secretory system conjugative DNA transfer family protein [Arcanobacterium hippocoleae]MDR6939243.1 type IV secretion system protein VirD4 [Arcanobacterium hippocoleae]